MEIIVEITFEKIFEDHEEEATHIERLPFPSGNLPTLAELEDLLLTLFLEWLDQLRDTMGQRPYDYGDMIGWQILGIT